MKTLSVLLLLAIGVGVAWWKITWPEGTVEDARSQATLSAERLRERLVAVRERITLPGTVRDGAVARPAGTATGDPPDASPDRATALSPARSPEVSGVVPVDSSATVTEAGSSAPAVPPMPVDGALLARLAEVERRLDAATRRETAMLDEIEALRERSGTDGALPDEAAVEDGETSLDERMDSLIDDLDERLVVLENRLGGGAGEEAARLQTLVERLDALDERVGLLADSAADDTVSVDTVRPELQGEREVPDERVDEETKGADASTLSEELERTRERLALLEERARENAGSSTAADDALATQAALARQLDGLERRLEALSGDTDPAIAESIGEVREQVDALVNSGFVTREDLRAQTEGRNIEYKIYFERGSTEVSPAARRVLDSFIAQEKNRTTGVSIFGFTDRQGSASFNQRLALQRATNVRSYLIQNGLPYTKIRALNGLGEDAAAAILPDEAEDAQQRVVVLFAAQP